MDRTQLKSLLVDIFTDVTGQTFGDLGDDQSLQGQLHLDSLDLVSIAIELHNRIGVTVEAAEVTGIATVGDLVSLLQTKLALPPANAA